MTNWFETCIGLVKSICVYKERIIGGTVTEGRLATHDALQMEISKITVSSYFCSGNVTLHSSVVCMLLLKFNKHILHHGGTALTPNH